NFMITGLVTINAIPSIVFFAITFIIFIQLKQIKASLRLEYFSWATFQRYRRLHTTSLDMALSLNSIYGRMLLAFFSIYLSSNTFIVTSIWNGLFSLITSFVLGNVVAFQIVAMVGFHFLAIMYTYRLHGTTKFLLHWIAQPPNCSSSSSGSLTTRGGRRVLAMNTATRVSLAAYVEKMNTWERYGI